VTSDMRRLRKTLLSSSSSSSCCCCVCSCISCWSWLHSTIGRTLVFGWRTDPVLCSACSRRV